MGCELARLVETAGQRRTRVDDDAGLIREEDRQGSGVRAVG